MVHILADTFVGRHEHVITAAVSIALALLLAGLVDRAFTRAARARPRLGAHLDAGADTRLRFLRRVVEAAILVLGIAVALSQFTALDRLAASVLASGAIAAAVIGFAARQTLANAVAGLLLAVSQPLRLGDVVTIEGETGTVEDVRLTYTYLRGAGSARIVIPNERLAAGILHNDTLGGTTLTAEASLWIGNDADVERAIAALESGVEDVSVSVGEVAPDGIRLVLARDGVTVGERAVAEARLRRAGLAALSTAGVPRPGAGPAAPPG
jgi:small-conductance mechanosensitive channel